MAKKARSAEALPDDLLALIHNPDVKTVKILFGTEGTDDEGRTLTGYTVNGSDANGNNVAQASVRKKTSEFRDALYLAMTQAQFIQTESYYDPRGGMQGDYLYERLPEKGKNKKAK